MSYSSEISRSNPSCFIFLIDQSGSMMDLLDPTGVQPLDKPQQIDGRTYTQTGQGRTKAQGVADAVNKLLSNLVIKCAKEEGIRDYYHVGVIGYGANVGPCFGGALSGKDIVPISEIGNNPMRIDVRTKKVDDGAGGLVDQQIKMPIWFDAVGSGGTPMERALGQAASILQGWLVQHPNCFPQRPAPRQRRRVQRWDASLGSSRPRPPGHAPGTSRRAGERGAPPGSLPPAGMRAPRGRPLASGGRRRSGFFCPTRAPPRMLRTRCGGIALSRGAPNRTAGR